MILLYENVREHRVCERVTSARAAPNTHSRPGGVCPSRGFQPRTLAIVLNSPQFPAALRAAGRGVLPAGPHKYPPVVHRPQRGSTLSFSDDPRTFFQSSNLFYSARVRRFFVLSPQARIFNHVRRTHCPPSRWAGPARSASGSTPDTPVRRRERSTSAARSTTNRCSPPAWRR